jgi:hypothetical protein
MSAGPFLAASTTITGSGISPISTGTGAVVGAITISTTNYSIAVTGTTGASAGALTTLSWTNPAIERALAVNVTVPGNSSLVLLSKDSSIYLEEADYLYLSAGTTNAIHATCGFEVIG